jgi:hypothetical protein
MPSARAAASTSDPCPAASAAASATRRRYGLPASPRPSSAAHSGPKASNSALRRPGSGTTCSSCSAVPRSMVSPSKRMRLPCTTKQSTSASRRSSRPRLGSGASLQDRSRSPSVELPASSPNPWNVSTIPDSMKATAPPASRKSRNDCSATATGGGVGPPASAAAPARTSGHAPSHRTGVAAPGRQGGGAGCAWSRSCADRATVPLCGWKAL